MAIRLSGNFQVLILIFFFLTACISGCMLAREPEIIEDDTTERIDLLQVPNGTFWGDYQIADIDYEVEVAVETHRIKSIKVIRGMQRLFVKKCALCAINTLIEEIVDDQSLEVDAISGATQTSWAIINAIQDALTPPYSHNGDG